MPTHATPHLHLLAHTPPAPALLLLLLLQRFRDLALDRRSWLFVTASSAAAAPAAGASPSPLPPCLPLRAAPLQLSLSPAEDITALHWYRSRFATLAAAVAASRPGDTILLEGGPGGWVGRRGEWMGGLVVVATEAFLLTPRPPS